MIRSPRFPTAAPALLALLAALPLCLPAAHARVVATVDGTPVFQRQVDRAVRQQIDPGRLAELPPEQRQAVIAQAERGALNELVGRILLANAARREGIQVSQDLLQERMNAIANRFAPGSTVEDFLARAGLEEEDFLRDVEESILIERLIDAKTADLPPPDPAEVYRYYQENPAEFRQNENVKLRHISLSIRGLRDPLQIDAKRRRLEEVRAQFLENPLLDFARMAQKHSEAPNAADGGLLGPFGRGQGVVEPSFEEAAFSQDPGTVGDIVETSSGFHLLKVEERNPARLLRFEEVQGPIATYLAQMQRREVMKQLVDEWRAVAKIERVGAP